MMKCREKSSPSVWVVELFKSKCEYSEACMYKVQKAYYQPAADIYKRSAYNRCLCVPDNRVVLGK